MRTSLSSWLLLILAVLALCLGTGCASSKPVLEHTPREFPLSHGQYSTTAGEAFTSPFAGQVTPQVAGIYPFERALAVETETTYYYHNHKYTCSYQVLFTGMKTSLKDDTRVAAGDVLGKATGESVFVVIRSKIFDPYLVSMAQVMPYRHHEYWYFYPGMLDASAMDWLSYAPFSKFRAEWNYLKTTRMQAETDFQYKTLVHTSLTEYPASSSDGTSHQTLVHEGCTLNLHWQKDFRQYLEVEYQLGSPIYLYLMVTSIKDDVYECQVRDYSLVSPDEIVEGYMADIQSQL